MTRRSGATSLWTKVTVAERKKEFRNIGTARNASASLQSGAQAKPRKNGRANTNEAAGTIA